MNEISWYELEQPGQVDSPALLIYKKRVAQNIQTMIRIAGGAERLVPHVKTHKMPEIVQMQMEAGIRRFKCATIAEAEMLAQAGARDIILAYQLTPPKAIRLLTLIRDYPGVRFSSLVDNMDSARLLNELSGNDEIIANVFIDIDNGMHRTGIAPGEEAFELYRELQQLPYIFCQGLHVYDGHIRDRDFTVRKEKCEAAFEPVNVLAQRIIAAGFPAPMIIAGGTPTFTVHALRKGIFCSPGTCLLWDEGYAGQLAEQDFQYAAVLLTRVISKPRQGLITTDLGHKSVAAENPLDKRIFFLNLSGYAITSQSEEHLVVSVEDWEKIKVGDILYGVAYHICPTVALYDEAQVVENGRLIAKWNIIARRKRISV